MSIIRHSLAMMFLAGVLASCGGNSGKDEKTQVKYETQVMKPESRVYNLYIPASLHGLSEVEVYPQVSGIIREVNFKDGFKVTKGQTLFVIDQTEHKLQVQNARAIVNSLHEAYLGTSELMKNGTNTYVEVLKAQEDLLTAQITEVENHFEGIQAVICLYTALGGF